MLGLHDPVFINGYIGSYLKCFKDATPGRIECGRCGKNLDDKYDCQWPGIFVIPPIIRKKEK